ncbi:Peptidyl-glycine alpha-amidating monooxygenase [Armadillidium vulgare]|nr:Peptidyl-glycine alpha-amidating monooxygenase [Armadillidium vulgare]
MFFEETHADKNQIDEIAKGNPHWPQAFYPVDQVIRVKPEEILHARCTYNSSSLIKHTYIGGTSDDEMCNLYLMYYTDAVTGSESGVCGEETYRMLTASLPLSSDKPLPPNPALEEMTRGENVNKQKEVTYTNVFNEAKPIEVEKKTQSRKDPQPSEGKYQLKPKPVELYNEYGSADSENVDRTQFIGKNSKSKAQKELSKETLVSSPRKGKILNSEFQVVDNWGPTNYSLGQVTAVSIDSRGDVVIFHRADRIWDGSTFNSENVLLSKDKPIEKATILHLRRDSGKVMHEWGANFFYMPHGLTLDSEDNIWLTDVGLHQVYKFPSGYGDGKPLLTLGTKFQPGSGDSHFCKPTDVVILKNGEFFVSDGYCNSRIIHYSPSGVKIKEFGSHSWANGLSHAPKEGTFNVPHALALTGDDEEVCVADRENGRVQCFNTGTGNFVKLFKISEWGERLFSVAISPKLDKVVKNTSASENGKENQNLEVKTGQLIEDKPNTLSLFSGGYSSLGVSSVVLGLLAVPIIVLSTLAIIMRCRKRGVHSRYIENSKFMNGLNGKHKNGGGLDLSSLLNKRRGFEQVATNDIDADDLDLLIQI